VCLLCVGPTTARLVADDWPNWRGPNRDAICRETGLLQAWPPEGPKLLWKATGLGVGYSGPAIVGTTLYTLGNLDGQEHVLALDTTTGKRLWAKPFGPVEYVGYSPGTRATPTLDGDRLYALGASGRLVSMDRHSGEIRWRTSFLDDFDAPAYPKYGGINISTPIASGDTVFAATGYNVGGGLARIEKTPEGFTAREVYFTKDMKNHHGGLILLDGYLYGANDPGILTCLEYATGKVTWRSRKPGKCSLLYADGMLYCRSETGPLTLVKASPDRFEFHGQFDQPDRSNQKAWPHLVIAHGQMYVRDQDVLLCYDVRARD